MEKGEGRGEEEIEREEQGGEDRWTLIYTFHVARVCRFLAQVSEYSAAGHFCFELPY